MKTILIIKFRAFDRDCMEPFINKTIDEAKSHIVNEICNTAVIQEAVEYEVLQVNILDKELLNTK